MKKFCFLLFVIICDSVMMYGNTDSVSILKANDVQRISQAIDEFNKKYYSEFKEIILDYFPRMTKTELDSLIIISEPTFAIDSFCLIKIDPEKNQNTFIGKYTSWNYVNKSYTRTLPKLRTLFKCDPVLKSVSFCLKEPVFDKKNLKISFRLYSQDQIQKYYIVIVDFTGYSISSFGHKDVESRIRSIVDYSKEYTSSLYPYTFSDSKLRLKQVLVPFQRKIFLVDLSFWLLLQRCTIFNNRIYSLNGIEKKFWNLPWENLPTEIEDCDIDSYFTKLQK